MCVCVCVCVCGERERERGGVERAGVKFTYFVVYCKVTDLHCHGDKVHSTVELILFKFLLQIHIFFAESAKHLNIMSASHNHKPTNHKQTCVQRWPWSP